MNAETGPGVNGPTGFVADLVPNVISELIGSLPVPTVISELVGRLPVPTVVKSFFGASTC